MDGHTVVVGRLPAVSRPASPATPEVAPPKVRSKRSRRFRKGGRVALNFVFLIMIGCVLIMVGPALLGYHRYVILTGSMTGTYDRGSIVYDTQVPVSSLKVGDPITYDPPPGFTSQTRVTHRIWYIHRGPDGARVFKTKGDANKHPDVWKFTLNRPMQDRVAFHIPEVGYLFLMLSIKEFRLVLVGVPALIIGLIMMRKLWREAGQEARRQKLAEQGWRVLVNPGTDAVLAPIDAPAPDRFPARLDLGLRPARAAATSGRRRARISRRSRVDLSLPLHVGRLTGAGTPGGARRSNVSHEQLAPGASIATFRLLVAHKV